MTDSYPFDLFAKGRDIDRQTLRRRPFVHFVDSLKDGAKFFEPGEDLEQAASTAIAVGAPLLITGDPGTGKTQTAYYVAHKLKLGKVLHFQVKSTSRAQDLLYSFDSVRYFRESWTPPTASEETQGRAQYVEKGPLWEALTEDAPRVLLIDEIDKAPRDFPNDLLHELDEMRFWVPELDRWIPEEDAERGDRPLVFLTSNNERRLPEPFLRRCVFHHIEFDEKILKKAVSRREKEFEGLDESFLDLALRRFLALRELNLEKAPSTGEYLVWLRMLKSQGCSEDALNEKLPLGKLPFLSLLIKHRQDLKRLSERG